MFFAAADVLHYARKHGICPDELEWALAEESLTPPLPCVEYTANIYLERAFRAVQAIIECLADKQPLTQGECALALKFAAKLNSLVHLVGHDNWNYWHLERSAIHYKS